MNRAMMRKLGLTRKQVSPEPRIMRFYRKIGRNDSCPCGSGKKFKHCECFKLYGEGQYMTDEMLQPFRKKS